MSHSTPVVLIVFNRPDLTEQVFERVRAARPRKLLIVSDGARPDRVGEAEKVAAARQVVEKIDWPCEMLTNYAETNMGCGRRIASGLDWAFTWVEDAIILEDDCLADPTLFSFCEQLLEHFRHDERIASISGANYDPAEGKPYSYYFSKYTNSAGWATWRRTWRHFDFSLAKWPEFEQSGGLSAMCDSDEEQAYWCRIFDRVHRGMPDVWDYQWMHACWTQSGLTVHPWHNLVTNIGFRADATHTCKDSPYANLPTTPIHEIKHPPFVLRDRLQDVHSFEHRFCPKRISRMRQLRWKIKRRLQRIGTRAA